MDIKNLQNNLANARANEALKAQEKLGAKSEGSSESAKPQSDRVTLTSMSSQILELERRASAATIDNQARIAELKQAIADGSYKVDAEKIADKLMKTELLFSKV
jgi:negative regulator of flagellin synthesis FlgM